AEILGRARLTGNQVRVQDARALCDLGQINIRGEISSANNLPAVFSQTGYQATVDVDLARLAGMLPRTLHLQKDTRITDGKLHAELTAQGKDQQGFWSGRLDTSDLKGVNGGRAIALQTPLALSFAVRKPADSFPVVEQLRCDSSFLKMSASGQQGSWTAT